MSYSKSIRRALESVTTTRYTPPRLKGDKDHMGNEDEFEDFPYIEDPTPFVTHKAMEHKLVEQPGVAPRDPGTPAADPAIGGGTPGGDPGLDPTMGTAGLGGGALGIGGAQDRDYVKLDSSEIGRVYEMKKIYARLTSVEAYLSESTDQNLLELRRGVGKAINLFEVVITNISKFKDKIDPIIVTFYEFLDQVYSILKKYHMEQYKER
jgi:hypothetical protein